LKELERRSELAVVSIILMGATTRKSVDTLNLVVAPGDIKARNQLVERANTWSSSAKTKWCSKV